MLKCKVCESGLVPSIDGHYIARDNGESGIAMVIKTIEGKLYDAFDCPVCGCQIIAQERKRIYAQPNAVVVDDDDEDIEEEEENGEHDE